jgi:hypothetical protein
MLFGLKRLWRFAAGIEPAAFMGLNYRTMHFASGSVFCIKRREIIMKKILATTLVLLAAVMLLACGAKAEPAQETAALAEEDGLLTCLDVANSPFEGGIRTVVDPAAGTVTFTKTDENGNDTVEYFTFVPAENTVEKYYYVSMMGTGFYYYYDLDAGEMVRLENDEHEDSTESAKENNRFDSANETMQSEVSALENYFSTQFGMSIADAAAGR